MCQLKCSSLSSSYITEVKLFVMLCLLEVITNEAAPPKRWFKALVLVQKRLWNDPRVGQNKFPTTSLDARAVHGSKELFISFVGGLSHFHGQFVFTSRFFVRSFVHCQEFKTKGAIETCA